MYVIKSIKREINIIVFSVLLLEFVRRIFFLQWLWSLFASFYLIAYTFWIPTLFDDLFIIISLSSITLIVGGGLLLDGLWRALDLEQNSMKSTPRLPNIRIWWLLGGILLIGYLLVYIPQEGRIVAHWPLDLAITVIAGVIMLIYSVRRITK